MIRHFDKLTSYLLALVSLAEPHLDYMRGLLRYWTRVIICYARQNLELQPGSQPSFDRVFLH